MAKWKLETKNQERYIFIGGTLKKVKTDIKHDQSVKMLNELKSYRWKLCMKNIFKNWNKLQLKVLDNNINKTGMKIAHV